MNVCCICATCGRHKLMERSLRFFLDQDYEYNHTLLIFNNSHISQEVVLYNTGEDDNKTVILVNQHIDSQTGKPYTTLGGVYNDALKFVPENTDVIVHWDDDDIFLPNHISEGVDGLKKAMSLSVEGKMVDLDTKESVNIKVKYNAYKPERSYYRYPGGVELMGNNLEPSVFVTFEHMKKYGYSLTTSDQHMPWFNALLNEQLMFIDKNGKPTMIYNWGDTDIPTFKTSGNAGSVNNFENYRNFSQDHGDLILTPWIKEDVEKYYNLVK